MRTDLDAVEELWRQVMIGRAPMLTWRDASMIAYRLVYLEEQLRAKESERAGPAESERFRNGNLSN